MAYAKIRLDPDSLAFAIKNLAVPVAVENGELKVAMIDPSDVELAAMRKCLKAFGAAAESIGFEKPLGAYSEAEALRVIDAIVKEPVGGAHRDPRLAADNLQTWIVDRLRELSRVNPETLVRQRFEKFRKMGAFRDELAVEPPPALRGKLRLHVLAAPPVAVSSTILREQLRTGRPTNGLLPAVRRHIEEHSLYQA